MKHVKVLTQYRGKEGPAPAQTKTTGEKIGDAIDKVVAPCK